MGAGLGKVSSIGWSKWNTIERTGTIRRKLVELSSTRALYSPRRETPLEVECTERVSNRCGRQWTTRSWNNWSRAMKLETAAEDNWKLRYKVVIYIKKKEREREMIVISREIKSIIFLGINEIWIVEKRVSKVYVVNDSLTIRHGFLAWTILASRH